MKVKPTKYLIDTNIILRYLLNDNDSQVKKIREMLQLQKEGKVELKCLSHVVIETIHVLKSFYKVPRIEITRLVGDWVKSAPFEIENRSELIWMLELYGKSTLGLVDLVLLERASRESFEIFSFDKKLINYKKSTK